MMKAPSNFALKIFISEMQLQKVMMSHKMQFENFIKIEFVD